MSGSERPPRRWFHHLIAVWITFHLFAITVHLIPVPPRTDNAALEIPEVKKEIDRNVDLIHSTGLYDGTRAQLREDGIELVRAYTRKHKELTWFARAYLRPIGSTQYWNMFGGNAKEHPKVMVVEVQPRGERDWVVFQDGRWGGTFVPHRHRKVRRYLGLRGRTGRRREYARYLARAWNAQHPDRPALRVKMYHVVHHTLPAAEVRAGTAPRPTDTTLTFVHTVEEVEE